MNQETLSLKARHEIILSGERRRARDTEYVARQDGIRIGDVRVGSN